MRSESRDKDVNRSSRLRLLPYDQISGVVGISYKAFTVQRKMISPGNILFFLRRSARTASSLRPFQLIVPTRRKRNDAAILSKLHFVACSCDNLLDISVYSIEKCTNDDSRNTVEIRIFRRLTRFDLLRWRFFSPSRLDKNLSPYRSSFTREKGRSFEFDRSTSS